jgi:hypothetical protein
VKRFVLAALVLFSAFPVFAQQLPNVQILKRLEVPGVLRVAALHPFTETPDTIESLWGVSAVEPVVRKSGEFHTVTFQLPEGQIDRVFLSAVDPAGEVVTAYLESNTFLIRVRTLHRPTVSKRGEQWFFLVTYFLQ